MTARPGRPELINSGYGRVALAELHRLVLAAKKADPLAPVTVLVPTNGVGVAARRWLAAQPPGIGNVTFTTVHRLAESLGAATLAAAGRRPVSPPVVLAALRHELARDPGVLAPVGDHPATEEALLRVDRELTGMTAAGIQRLSAQSRRAADVVRLHRSTRARLAAKWYDEADLLEAAVERLTSLQRPERNAAPLIIFLPQRFSPRARQFLARVADLTPTTVVAAMTTGQEADEDVRDLVSALGLNAGLPMSMQLASVTEVAAADADEEVRVAIRHLLAGLDGGLRLDRCAILYPNEVPYATLVADRLDEAGLVWNGPDGRDLSGTLLGRSILALLQLAGSDLRRPDVFAFLADAPVRYQGREVPVSRWERISRDAGIVSGRAEWAARLATTQEQLRFRATGAAARGDDGHAEHLEHEADHITPFAAFIEDLAAQLDRLARPRSWRHGIGTLSKLIDHLLGNESVRGDWPIHEQRLAGEVEAMLEQLANLDPVDPLPDLDRFRRAITHALTNASVRRGRLGTGLVAGPLAEALGLDLDLVIIVGAADGVLPAVVGDDPVLPDQERWASRELPSASSYPWQQQRQFLAAAAAAGDGALVVIWPKGDLRQKTERRASRWIMPLLGPQTQADVGSYARSLREAEITGTEREARLRSLAAGSPPADDDLAYARAERMLLARQSDVFSPFDGHVGEHASHILRLRDSSMSPTRLQTWAICPHAYFVRYVLGVEPLDDPADELTITPLDEGNLVHEVLDYFVSAAIDRRASPDWTSPAETERLREIFIREANKVEKLGRTGRAVYWRYDRQRVWTNVLRFITDDAARLAASNARPIGCEVKFGDAGQTQARLTLPDGRELAFRGTIDRVDISMFGHLQVTDYKTGNPSYYTGLSADTPDERGSRLQLPIYALAARNAYAEHEGKQVHSHYRFISAAAKADSKSDVGYEVHDELLALFATSVGIIVDGIEQGLFPNRPAPTTRPGFIPCRYCDPDGMGVADVERAWQRKHGAAELNDYRRLLGEETDSDADSTDVRTDDGFGDGDV
jgi:ATP-dependent helicase/nuclease subunit B